MISDTRLARSYKNPKNRPRMSNFTGETRSIGPAGFDLLYEKGPCLVVVKPGGLATQAPPGIDSLEVRVKEFLRTRDGKTGKVYLGIPHRLDRPVSGVMVLARHVRAARCLAEQFEARTVIKKYWAVVEGVVSPDAGTWTDHLRKIPEAAQVEIVSPEHPEGRLSDLVLPRAQRAMAGLRGWKSTWKQDACTRFASRPRRVRTRWWATHNTEPCCLSDRSRMISDAVGLPCTPAAWNFGTP